MRDFESTKRRRNEKGEKQVSRSKLVEQSLFKISTQQKEGKNNIYLRHSLQGRRTLLNIQSLVRQTFRKQAKDSDLS